MSGGIPPITDDDLNAFIDDRLDEARRRCVEDHLQAHPDVAQRVEADLANRAAIRAAFRARTDDVVPATMTVAGILAQRAHRRSMRAWLAAACFAIAMFAGGVMGWMLRTPLEPGRADRAMILLEQQALASHAVFSVDARHPVEVPGSEDAHLRQWFSNRLHRVVMVPNLSALGYHLIGGRLLATERGNPAALLMYEDAAHHRMSVILRPMGQTLRAPGTTIEQDGVNGRAWIADGMGVAVVAALPVPSIAAVASQISSEMRATG